MEKHLVQVIDVEAPPSGLREPQQLVLDLDGFEGPIDLLLALARDQKVDLTQISILALADQYLAYIESVRQLRLELASDYLVMAAWLAYLKSRLLDPQTSLWVGLAGWLDGWLAGWLAGWAGWLAGLAGWLAGCGWLAGL